MKRRFDEDGVDSESDIREMIRVKAFEYSRLDRIENGWMILRLLQCTF
jgi:hypothetical protein